MTGRALVAQANALSLPLRDESVDLVVTSPPFWNLRDYGVAGQLGNEPRREEFLEHLWAVTAECRRVMKPTASLFVELGDSYNSSSHWMNGISSNADPTKWTQAAEHGNATIPRQPLSRGYPVKSLHLTPQRYAIGCVDRLGLTLRAEIIWSRVNGLPESVRDRVRMAHSRIYHFTRGPRYYSAVDEVREPQQDNARPNGPRTTLDQISPTGKRMENSGGGHHRSFDKAEAYWHPLGKLPGSVWAIPSEPLRLPDWLGVQHYAAFPSELPRRIILGWSPPGICVACGEGRWPVVERRNIPLRPGDQPGRANLNGEGIHGADRRAGTHMASEATILGYACKCCPFTDHPGTGERNLAVPDRWDSGPQSGGGFAGQARDAQRTGPWREYHLDRWQPPPTRPSVVLDCFGGTGTTALVARALGRVGLSFDLSFPYSRAARWRVTSDHAAKAISRTNRERQGSLL